MPSDVMEVTNHFMRNPIRILVKKEELTLEGIKQFYVQVHTVIVLRLVTLTNSHRQFGVVTRLSARNGNWIRCATCTTL